MKRQIRIAPSILAADFGNMREEVRAVISAGAEILHVDVMDGHFVPNLTLGPAMIQALRESVQIPFDVHLMVEEPDHLIPAFLKAMGEVEGSFLTVHQEACHDLPGTIRLIRELSPRTRVGVSIKPGTSVSALEGIEDMTDLVLLMTVEPGFGGQGLIPECLDKIPEVRELFRKAGKDVLIELDGGVKLSNLELCSGADLLVMGSAVFKAGDPDTAMENMKKVNQRIHELSVETE